VDFQPALLHFLFTCDLVHGDALQHPSSNSESFQPLIAPGTPLQNQMA
jgi:hypothetical protein